MALNTGWSGSPALKKRFVFSSLTALTIFALLLLRLWYLQIIRSDDYRLLSERNRTRYVTIAAPRGPIVDRSGHVLVDNRPAFRIAALRQEVTDPETMLARLAEILDLEPELLEARWAAGRQLPRYRPVPLADDVSREAMEKVMERSFELPGVLTEIRPIRFYPHRESAAHLLGYLGEITEEELRSPAYRNYQGGDFIGKNGLEKVMEAYLNGIPGEHRVEVDVLGKKLRILKTREPLSGQRLTLTIDRDLQLATEAAFGDQAGAAVAIDVRTGEVLALVSMPNYDPSLFARGISGREWLDLLQNPLNPLQNRALTGQYAPGSIFKIVTALAALEFDPSLNNFHTNNTGQFVLGNQTFRDSTAVGRTISGLREALQRSSNIWFYEVSLKIGIDRIATMARRLGLGTPTGIGLAGERAGLIPDSQWKRRRFNDRWYQGETVIASIGQGYILTTPLQLANLMATVANGGTVLRPYLIKEIDNMRGQIEKIPPPQPLQQAHLNPAQLELVRQGLKAVVNERGGTAFSSRLDELSYAGKTGTAQVVAQAQRRRADQVVPYRLRDHALFGAFAPSVNPEIAVAVVVEHGGSGGATAAPIARAMFESYFKLREPVADEDTQRN